MTKLPQLLALAAAAFVSLAHAAPIPDEFKTNGFAIGCQAYTFNRFTAFEAIEKTAAAGGKVIEFYPGQRLSKEEPNVKWDHNASDEVIAKVQAKLAEHKVEEPPHQKAVPRICIALSSKRKGTASAPPMLEGVCFPENSRLHFSPAAVAKHSRVAAFLAKKGAGVARIGMESPSDKTRGAPGPGPGTSR